MTVRRLVKVLVALAPIALAGCTGLSGDFGAIGRADPDAAAAYERGKAEFLAGHFGLAVKHFQLAADRDPSSVEALNGLAAAYDRLGRFDLSARYYQRALMIDPNSAQTLNNIGYSYLMQNRQDLAVAYLRDAYARDQDDPIVVANRQAAESALAKADVARAAPRQAAEAPTTAPETRPERHAAAGPWIERTAPDLQSLVTTPQVALAGAGDLDPSLVDYRPAEPHGAAALPEYMAAPMADPLGRSAAPAVKVARAPLRAAVVRLVTEPADRAPLPPPGPESGAVIEVSNGTGRLRMAARISEFLGSNGLGVARLSNADHFSHLETTIFYREGWKRLAQHLADLLPAGITLKGRDDQDADIRIELGGDLLDFDRDLYYAGTRRSVDAAMPG